MGTHRYLPPGSAQGCGVQAAANADRDSLRGSGQVRGGQQVVECLGKVAVAGKGPDVEDRLPDHVKKRADAVESAALSFDDDREGPLFGPDDSTGHGCVEHRHTDGPGPLSQRARRSGMGAGHLQPHAARAQTGKQPVWPRGRRGDRAGTGQYRDDHFGAVGSHLGRIDDRTVIPCVLPRHADNVINRDQPPSGEKSTAHRTSHPPHDGDMPDRCHLLCPSAVSPSDKSNDLPLGSRRPQRGGPDSCGLVL